MADLHGVVRTDNMAGTTVNTYLESVKYHDSNSKVAAIDNGNVVKLAGLMSGEREVYKAVDVAATTALKDVVLIATPEVFYDERQKNLDEFYNEAGRIARAYHFHEHDEFGLNAKAMTIADEAEPAVGWVAELAAGHKIQLVETVTTTESATSTIVGHVVAIEAAGRYTYYVIRVD